LAGSIRPDRQSFHVAKLVSRLLQAKAVEVDLIDLAETRLPLFGDDSGGHEMVATVGEKLRVSDAMIFVSPEYHGSFSGTLKNALDHFWSEFTKKPIGVATASTGRLGGINASTQLQHVILSLGAFPMPLKLMVPEVRTAFDENSQPKDDNLLQVANNFIDLFLWFANALSRSAIN
jgi:NAD(P)H-dependent FMN reductase